MCADVEETNAAAGGSYATPFGILTVTAPALFGHYNVLPILADVLASVLPLLVESCCSTGFVKLIEEGIDVAARINHLSDSSCDAIKVGTACRVICGAPAYFRRYGLSDLAPHTIIAATA